LNKFLNLDPSDSKKVLNSYKLKKEKTRFLNKQKLKHNLLFNKQIFSYRKKVLDFKILVFLQLLSNANKFNNKTLLNPFLKGKNFYFSKSVHILIRSAFILLSLLNSNKKVNGNKMFNTKKRILAFIQFLRYSLYSNLSITNISFKSCYYNFTLKYFLFVLYFELKTYLNSKLLKQGTNSEENLSNLGSGFLIKSSIYTKSKGFYNKNVYQKLILQPEYNSVNLDKAILDYKICRKQLFEKKIFLDDKRYFKVQSLIKNFFKFKKVKSINISQLTHTIIKNVMPVYKLTYQRRGRNKVLVAKYLFINKIRESLAIKSLLKFLPPVGNLNKKYRRNELEYKIALSLLDSFFHRGVAFENHKKLKNNLKGNIFNKGTFKNIKTVFKKKK